MSSLTFEPLMSTTLWLTLAVTAVALLSWYGWARRPHATSNLRWTAIIALSCIGLGIVLIILLNPTWVRQLPPAAGKPLLNVLVDSSASMATPDTAGAHHRFAAAAGVAQEIQQQLSDRFDVHLHVFDATVRRVNVDALNSNDPKGSTTDMAGAIASAVTTDQPQGQALVLLGDGIQNAQSDGAGGVGSARRVLDAVRAANSMTVPIYTHTFGGEVGGSDLAVTVRSPQDLAVVGQKLPLSVQVKSRGSAAVRCQLILLQDARELARQEVNLTLGQPFADVHFVVGQDKVGLYSYEVRADPVPGEVSQANNSASYLLRVVDRPIRVLLLEGKPYWDSKFITRTLASDPAVILDSVVQLAPGRLIRRTISRADDADAKKPSASTAPSKLSDAGSESSRVQTWKVLSDASQVLGDLELMGAYQIIVIGRDAEPFVSDAAVENLHTWVARQGGALICYRGSPTSHVNQKLARLLPVKWSPRSESRFRMALTDQGKDLRWALGGSGERGAGFNDSAILGQLPTLAAAERIADSKPLAVSLAVSVFPQGGESEPAVVYHPYGSGRSVVIEGSGMWRWAFLPPKYKDHEVVYGALWHSLLHWLTSDAGLLPGQSLSLRSDKVTFSTEEPATVTLLAREETEAADLREVQLVSDATRQATSFRPSPVGDDPGVYRINFGKLPEGRYRAQVVGTPEVDSSVRIAFDVRSFGEEHLNLQARPDLMARIAAESGGAVLTSIASAAPQIERAFRDFLVRSRPPVIERSAIWDRWWALMGVIALWAMCWAMRRSGGLI